MSQERRISRYRLIDQVDSPVGDPATTLWRGHDEVLDREVSIRLLDADDPRAPSFLGAARAAALVEDRRLLRILDVLNVPADHGNPPVIAVVSEWARGKTLAELLHARSWAPMSVEHAVSIIDDVARAVATGLGTNVSHGRLRPSSVIVTDAGEVRVRGLSIDAALWGPLHPHLNKTDADVDGLGSLLYLLVTGLWPGTAEESPNGLPLAPRDRDHVLPPSRVSADVPRTIDDCVARSVHDAARPRGVTNVSDADGFAAMLGVSRDFVSGGADPGAGPLMPSQRRIRAAARGVLAIIGVIAAGAVGVLGWQLVNGGPSAWSANPESDGAAMLSASASPATDGDIGIEQILTTASVRSFDPFGDDNGNGKADGRKGRENDADAPLASDGLADTAWTSDRYSDVQAGGKGGVGLVLDLGTSQSVSAVSLDFAEVGAMVEVRVADKIYRDPGTWNLLARAPAGGQAIEIRTPRPIVGRYVLLWFADPPPLPSRAGSYQVGVSGVVVRG
jgi:hypothetical protein